jgi:hypothetical protein
MLRVVLDDGETTTIDRDAIAQRYVSERGAGCDLQPPRRGVWGESHDVAGFFDDAGEHVF